MSVVAAVERDLEQMRERAPELADSTLAASALVLAGELDSAKNSATSKSMCARALAETMEQLRAQLPPEVKADGVDDIRDARKKRRQKRRPAA